MIKQFVDSLHQEFPDNQIIFNMEYSGEGAA
jgi:isocitrate lyase